MANAEPRLETAEALSLIGMGRRQWDSIMQRQLYRGAPPVKAGHPRWFDRDDIVALFAFDYFNRLGVGASMAGRVATAVRTELRKGGEDLATLWITTTADGRPQRVMRREPVDEFRHAIPVAELRRNIVKLVAQKLEERDETA